MKIIELKASNVKRLKAVDITPDGTLQVIGGRNAQGKSSVLDAIWLALGGGKASKGTTQPIRDGEDTASVTVDLGELVVTRSWTQSGTKLTVQNAEGAAYKSPQGMLDALVGELSFDPLQFTRLSAREQRDALLDLVELDVDLDALDRERQAAYDERTQVGRDGKAVGEVTVDESLPTEEHSASQIISMIQSRQGRNVSIRQAQAGVSSVQRERRDVAEKIRDLQSRLAELDQDQKLYQAELDHLGDEQGTDDLEKQLSEVEDTNAEIRANNTAKARKAEKTALRAKYEELTRRIDHYDTKKADALAAAEFPVEGLAFDEHGVTYQGVPLSQASSAEQIKVSLAMAMALNPKLRVLRIMDGSLLDDEAMTAIRDVVAEHDFQLWIERVGNADEGAVIIEDGEAA